MESKAKAAQIRKRIQKDQTFNGEAMSIDTIANRTKSNAVLAKPWQLAVIFGFAFLFLMLTMNMFINIYDEGVILFDSVRILSGDVPYRDFYANYGPAQFYVLAALFKMFGPSVMIERMWDLFIRSSTDAPNGFTALTDTKS